MAEADKTEKKHADGIQVPHVQPMLGLALRQAFAQGRKRQAGAALAAVVATLP